MRSPRVLLLTAAVVTALAGGLMLHPAVQACGKYFNLSRSSLVQESGPAPLWTIKLPNHAFDGRTQADYVGHGKIVGDRLVSVSQNGHLLVVDFTQPALRDLGNFGGKLLPQVDVLGDTACIASKDKLLVIDLATGKLRQTVAAGQPIQGFGFVDAERFYVQGDKSFCYLDQSGKATAFDFVLSSGDLSKRRWHSLDAKPVRDEAGKRLFVAVTDPSDHKCSVAILDLPTGKLLKKVAIPGTGGDKNQPNYIGQMLLHRDRLYVANQFLGYGVWMHSLGSIDLANGNYQTLKLPEGMLQGGTLISDAHNTVALATMKRMDRLEANGRWTKVAGDDERLPLGWWHGSTIHGGATVRAVPMAAQVSKTN